MEYKIIKKLGVGMFGTTYLVKIGDQEYAMKIQHILPQHRKKNFKSELWREMDLYKYISKMHPNDRKFFTQIHSFDIFNHCTHKQEGRPWMPEEDTPFGKELRKLNKSDWCVRYIIDYQGETTLAKFLEQNPNLPLKQIHSLILQICKIIYILYQGKYSHNDLHPGNIMVKPTKEKTFDFFGKKVPYFGHQLVAIDFGEVIHKKFDLQSGRPEHQHFQENRRLYFFKELYIFTMAVIFDMEKMITACKKQKKKLPWEIKNNSFDKNAKEMLKKHMDYVKEEIQKYYKIFPEGQELWEYVIKNIGDNREIPSMVKGKKGEASFWQIQFRLLDELMLKFPEDFKKIFLWCSLPDFRIPHKEYEEILVINSPEKYIKYFLNKV